MEDGKALAVDIGASGGRVMLGEYDGAVISVKEVHRFPNDPVVVNGTMYWDVLRLFYEMKQGILKAKVYGSAGSIGVDTWGVDFGLLDEAGNLLENPIHYRDGRTKGMLEEGLSRIPQAYFYEITGNQFMEINTVFQLLSMSKYRPERLEQADCMLMMPDLFLYFLSGIKKCEISIASTTQMHSPYRKGWVKEVIESFSIPEKILMDIVPAGTVLGGLREEIQEELGVRDMDVIAVAGHDTQCALAAVPTKEESFIFISCGTWSLFGTELAEPIITKQSEELNITNEIGAEGKVSFLKNIIGLWLIQESRRQWIREGTEYRFSELESMGNDVESFPCHIDPDAPEFVAAGNIPQRIREYCKETGQKIPQTEGEIVRCINESLALKYRHALEEIQSCTRKKYPVIHMVGGGTQSAMLCQLTANACKIPVIAGPVEATVFGNLAIQFMAKGVIADLKEARRIISESVHLTVYEPKDTQVWDTVYGEYKRTVLKLNLQHA